MLKWLSGEEGEPGSRGPGSPRGAAGGGGEVAVEEMAERLTQTEQLVTQLKEMIREKDAALCKKDDQLKVEKEACEAKLSKMRLQNKAKVTSLTTQLEELKKQQGAQGTPTHSKKGSSEVGEQASRGKIVLLKKKVEELEQQLAQRDGELESMRQKVETRRQRGEEMDAMLTEKDKKLAEKEAYIVHLQTALAGDQPVTPAPQHKAAEDGGAMHELQLLVQSLTKKVGEAEERYSLLQEQTESLKELLATEKEQFSQKERMYKQNIQTFKDIILQKDNQLMEVSQMHEQELFRLAAKSDASADLEQLLKALKQKLHEKEEVLLGKTQVIDVLQGEVDGRDQQIKELTERLRRLQVERESLESKMEAEKHVMRAQLRDLMEKHQVEVQRMTEQHQAQVNQVQQELLGQLEVLRKASVAAPPAAQDASGTGATLADSASIQRAAELEARAKQKTEEASRSEAKFLKMKAWSKSRIRQLEEELKKSQAGAAPPDLTALRSRVTALEEEREENLWRVEQYEELKAKNEMLEAKLVVYEEQQRTLQADLEQFTKRAASQASESGSADDPQSQVLEWQEMVAEAVSARDRAREEKTAMVLRMSHMEEEREALATRQQELEEELAQAQGLGQHRAKKLAVPSQRSLQEDFEFEGPISFQDPRSTSESTTPMEGENMGGWWPEYNTPDTDGLRSVVEELELERNQLQEQILSLEERCQDLQDRLQLQARIEALQNESEKLQSQLASVRSQQSREAEKHQLLVASLNEQLKGLSDTQECLESSLIEKENTLAKASEKLELINSLRESLTERESQYKEVSEKLLHTEHTLESVSRKCSSSEKQGSELKTEVADLLQKLNVLKDKTQKQEVAIETLQTELDQTNEELDKLNTSHLEERAQLIHDLQICEREIDSLKDILLEKDKEISTLSGNMAEYAEQVTVLKQEVKLKEENLVRVESALSNAERQAMIIRDSQDSDQQTLNSKISELLGELKDTEEELVKAKEERDSSAAEVEQLMKQAEEDKKAIQHLRGEVQKQTVSHRSHLSECETHITSLKEQLSQKLQQSEGLALQLKDKNTNSETLQQQLRDKEQTYETELKSFKEERNQLLAQVEKCNHEIQTLSKELEEQVQSKGEIQEKLETIAALEKQLKTNDQKFNSELRTRDSENQKLSSELQSKCENISKLESVLESMKAEEQRLHEKLKGLNEELDTQKQNVTELKEKVTAALELNGSLQNHIHSLTQEEHRLKLTVTESVKTISELTGEKDSLLANISILEAQRSQNNVIVEGLQKDKEELTVRNSELNQVFEQSTLSNSEILLAKTNECSNLTQLLREREDKVTQLQEQVQSLSGAVDQLHRDVAEKEQKATDLLIQLEARQKQLQETSSLLKEQESLVMEKDATLKERQDEYDRLHNEVTSQRNAVSKLQAEAEVLREERSRLRQQVEDGEEMLNNMTQQCQKHTEQLSEANDTVKSLTDQISVLGERSRRLESDAELKQTELVSLSSRIQAVAAENHHLRTACDSREKELTQQTQAVLDLNGQLKATVEQNSSFRVHISSLTEHNQRLQQELAQKTQFIGELTSEGSSLQEKYSALQIQMSDNQKTVEGLLKKKEELTIAADELRNVLKESELSHSAGLLEKTRECADLSETLRGREEQLQSLHRQVEGLQTALSQRNLSFSEKEKTLSEQLEAQQNQVLQLQDTISMLQEQGSVLKSGLLEKEALFQQKAEECSVFQNELKLQQDLVSQRTVEVQSLRHECVEATRQMEQKEQALNEVTHELRIQKEELNKQNESVISLSSQLGAMNESAASMEIEITNLNASVEKLRADNCQLQQETDQKKAEIIDFKDSVQALNEQNAKLKSELYKAVTELSKAQEEVSAYKTAACDRDSKLKTAYSEKEKLNASLKQQESLIQKLSSTVAEQEQQLKQKTDDSVSLSAKVSELEDRVSKFRSEVDGLTSESSILRNALETKEQSSSATAENLTSDLHTKEAECENLKEQISHLEESVTKLNSSLQVQVAEVESLKKALEEKETALLDKSKFLQDLQRRADEASLFKSQFVESTELVSELQGHIQQLSAESENLRKSAEETQSAFSNLQEKYAANLEELQGVKKQLSQRSDEVSKLRGSLDASRTEHQNSKSTIETLRNHLAGVSENLRRAEDLNSSLSKEKDEAFASHGASVSLLTVEIERLKAQHLQVVAQMTALTENLEQREMALHAINSQFTAQAKHASQLVSEIQTLQEQNQRLADEISLLKEEHQKHLSTLVNDNTHLQQEVRKLFAEKEELEQRHQQVWTSQGELQVQVERQSSSMKESLEKMVSEKESLQAKVSAKDEEVSQLKENIHKVEQILQDSEKEWLLVLDREKQDKNLLAEQVRGVENEMKSKDLRVNALKQDLDSLHEKLAEASAAIRQGSDQLSSKELEASASRIQLEKVLASVQEKDSENRNLQQTLKTVEKELHKLLASKNVPDRDSSVSPPPCGTPSAFLQHMIKLLQETHQSEVDALRNELDETVVQLRAQSALEEGESRQTALLQETVAHLQTQLKAETEKAKESAFKHASLDGELQVKEEQISCMNIQIGQQKELLAGLSQQLRDKDASVAQVMEAASNERMKLSEEKTSLLAQIETMEQTRTKELEDVSQKLEVRLSLSQSEAQSSNSERLELIRRNEGLQSELAKASKEKDAVRKKLQAALILRKELLKKVEEYENQKEESLNDKRQVSLLQDKLEDAAHQAQAAATKFQVDVSLLEKNILDKEREILELKMQSEIRIKQSHSEKHNLQTAMSEKEVYLSEILQTLNEKNALIKQLQSSSAEKEEEFERERRGFTQKLDELEDEMKTCKEELKDKYSSAATAVDLENELAQMKLEKAMLQKKAQAALLSRKETMKKAQESERKVTQELSELKDDYKALLGQHCQQTNELNAVQLKFDENAKELEYRHETCLSHMDKLDTLRKLVEERDKTLQNLKVSLSEKESQCHSLQAEVGKVTSRMESMSLALAGKEEALQVTEQQVETLKSKLYTVENELEKAREETERRQETVRVADQENVLFHENVVLKTENISEATQEQHLCAVEDNDQILMEQKEAALDQSNRMKDELEATVALVSQKSSEVVALRNTLTTTEQRLNEDKDVLTKELEKTKLRCADIEMSLNLVRTENENAFRLIDELRYDVTTRNQQLKEVEELNEQQKIKGGVCPQCSGAESKLKQNDDALSVSQAQLSEKEQLIAALELQLQQQIQRHEIAVQKMKAETAELQKSQEDSTKRNSHDNQNKITLLTRKLQAALVSRKDLKEEVEKLSAKHAAKEAECSALQSSVLDLESSVSSLSEEKGRLGAEVDRILNDNRSLSAACDSLKLTIENITQQKQAFSCQLESLKDSQTEELSKWKSSHAELKQEYESLLQAYENVSSEMDKMRQLLEAAKRDRQEALRKIHKHESDLKILERRAREMEEENEGMKEKMHRFSKEKRHKIEELEEENLKFRRELTEIVGNQKMSMSELTSQKQQLEAEICQINESGEDLRVKFTKLQDENSQLAENLEKANCILEKKHLESNTYTNSMQLKLDEALGLNNSLTAQIDGQKTELGAQLEINKLLQKEKQNLSERVEKVQNDYEVQLAKKDDVIKELEGVITKHSQDTISLNEKVRILEDDKSLLQEELENVQEISDKVKNENEYLETVILKNAERIDELTECVNVLQSQNAQLSSQLAASKEASNQVRQEKEEEQLKLVREFEEKLKTVQRGNEGSKNVKKELRELLKEKHQEINQLQQNCIQYQEVILDLESSLKSSQSARDNMEREVKRNSERVSGLEARGKDVEADLITHKNLLQEATEKIVSIQSERDQLAVEISQRSNKLSEDQDQAEDKTKMPQNVDEKRINSYREKQHVLQQQICELNYLRDKESEKVNDLMQQLDSRDLQINTLKRAAETNEAKLSALSSAPRGADATNVWNDLYQKSLHEKDSQLLEQGFVIKRFLEDMRVKDKEVNELRVTKSRLERTLNEYSVAAAAQQRQLFVLSASNAELSESVELMAVQVSERSSQVERIEREKNALNRQLVDKDDVISQLQLNIQQLEEMNADTDAQLLLFQSQNDKLQADFEKQEGISLQLKTLLQGKDAEISSLLSCKDGQMSGYLEQLQTNYRSQVAVYEDRLASLRYQREKADKELRVLEAKAKSLQVQANKSVQEKEQTAAKMDSFKNSLVSLQSERERLMSEYRMLEAKSELGLKGKEGSADGEGGAAKGLKHEIRKLLHQMDDLNSENAMLRAQLVRYREDLNQVLSLKDNQLKVLLKKQQDVIKTLENQKAAAEKQHRECRLELHKEEEASATLKAQIPKLQAKLSKLEAEMLTQEKERVTTSEGKVIANLQEAVEAKAAECNRLQQKLLSQKMLTDELKEERQQVETETNKKLSEAEDKYNGELDTFEREAELMRSEREVADQRVAELAKDLLEMEQQLSEAKMQSKDLKAQNESLCKAMAALQNDRDQLIEDFKVLRNRYDEELRETQTAFNRVERSLQDASSDLAAFSKERDLLVHKLKAVESKDAHAELNKMVDELSKALSEKERELKHVVLENGANSRQLSAFSRSMASLQNDRDRLMDELVQVKRAVESRQGSIPDTVTSTSGEKSKRRADSAVSNEKNGQMELQQTQNMPPTKDASRSQEDVADAVSERKGKDTPPVRQETVALVGQSGLEDVVSRLEAERVQLHRDLQRCLYEIQQRDQYLQQLNTKLQQAVEEKGAVAAQLRAVSQTLRDTQHRCQWLEARVQDQAQGSVYAEVAPGAPQERSSDSLVSETAEASQLRERLLELELSLTDERTRRESAEESLRLAEDRAKSLSRDAQRDFSIDMETEEEWETLSLNPNQPLITRKVKGGMVACRRWLRGRSLYFSRLLTSRARSRYVFLAYLLTIHVLVLMCLAGAL